MRSFDQAMEGDTSGSLRARVREFSSVLDRMQELPPRFGIRVPPEGQDPSLLRDALERLQLEHRELCAAREVLQAEYDELESTRRALEFERRRYRDLFDLAIDPYLRADPLGVIREVNLAAGRLLGVEPSALIGRPFESVIEGGNSARIAAALKVLRAEGAVEVTLGLEAVGSTKTRVILRATTVGNGVLWCARPIDEHLELLRDSIDRLPGDRPSDSCPTWQELDAANRAKDRVLAILGHELRTPINVILGWAALVRRDRLDTEAHTRAMAVIERTALTQAVLLDRLLDVSRLTAHKLAVVPTRLDLGVLARQAIEAIGPIAAQREITVSCHVSPELFVQGDAERLSQVLFNLLTNAMKYSPAGSTVVVRGERVQGERGAEVRLSIIDHGCGIEPKSLQMIFECFRQVDERQKCLSGLGLGLFIVREIVALHGGQVHAESAGLGTGSEFIVELPADATAP